MARPVETIHEEIRALSAPEKGALLRWLWEELDGPASADVDAKWLAEARRRDAEFDSGAEPGIPGEEVFEDIRASLNR
jgi:putative addiction module component (TIGR02574 family)